MRGPWLDLASDRLPQPGQRRDTYRGRTEIPAFPGVGREVVQDKVTQGLVEVLAYGGVDGLKPWPQAAMPSYLSHSPQLLTSKNSQQPRWGQEGTGCSNTGRESRVSGTHIVPPASPLVLPQVQVTGVAQEARLTAARSQGLRKRA